MLKKKNKSYGATRSTEFLVAAESQASALDKVTGDKIKKQCWTPYLGAFYAFMSSLTILVTNVFVKKLTYINAGQLSMIRNLSVFIGNIPVAIYCTKNIFGPKEYFWLLVMRSFLGATALYLNLLAYKHLPMTDASIILSTVPALVALVARFHLKEPCGFIHVVSIILTVLGVLTSLRLPEYLSTRSTTEFTKDYITGLVSAFSCVVVLTFTFVSLRKMQNIHFSVILLYFGALGTIENGVLTALLSNFSWPRCGGWDAIQVTLIGVFGFLGHCFMTLGIQKEAVSIIATCRAAFDIMISSVFQILFFSSVPDVYTLGGGLLVLIAVGSLGLWKWLTEQPEDSVHRKRLKWLLL